MGLNRYKKRSSFIQHVIELKNPAICSGQMTSTNIRVCHKLNKLGEGGLSYGLVPNPNFVLLYKNRFKS